MLCRKPHLFASVLILAGIVGCGDNGDPVQDDASITVDAAPPDGAPRVEICDNEFEDDGDGFIDCDDEDCALEAHCQPEMECADGEDNDNDGDEDCADSDCAASPVCLPEGACSNGADDDLDGMADCADPDCDLACLAGCPDGDTLVALSATGLPQTVDTADVLVNFPVTVDGWVRGVAVRFTIPHSFPADLDITLVSPASGPTIDLTSDNGGSGEDYIDTYLTDSATTPISSGAPPFTGRYRPEEPFTGIIGLPTLAQWRIQVHDDFSGETGTVESMDLFMCVCNGTDGCESHAACLDGVDNDGDALVDCADTDDCSAIPQCAPETECADGLDNNQDGLIDCADPDCNGIGICEQPETTCTDNLDNDGDGGADCDDSNCFSTTHCLAEPDCGDGTDDDNDGLTDCADVGCDGSDGCELGTELSCTDAFDNDGDGASDCADTDCGALMICTGLSCPTGTVPSNRAALGLPEPIVNGTPLAIEIPVGRAGLAQVVAVKFDATHLNDADLDVFLVSPTGVSVELFTDVGSTGDNFTDTILIDSAATAITAGTAPFTGQFRPERPLSAMVGAPVFGDWTLQVTDDVSSNNGTLNRFEVLVCHCDAATGDCEFGGIACRNGIDDDGDSLVDCAETSCATDPFCIPEAICDDNIDQDLDGLTDCRDPHCDGISGCEVGLEETCTDLFDNDADSAADCADSDCSATAHCMVESDCTDGVDNDSDGRPDCRDVGCDGVDGCELDNEFTCNDVFDNDGDGLTDCADPDCAPRLFCNVSCPDGTTTMHRISTDVPVAILDNTTVTSTVPVATAGEVLIAAVKVDITHTYDSDIDMYLDAPGATVELSTDNGGSGDNYNGTIFIDSAPGTIGTTGFNTAPFAGQYRPEQPLSNLRGTELLGDWDLRIFDDVGADQGTLNNYEVLVCHCDPTTNDCEFFAECRNGVEDDADGLIDCADPNCATDPFCIPEAVCDDGVDQDLDTLADCLDPDCNGIDGCELGTEVTCLDQIDNDGDGLRDCFDSDCSALPQCEVELDCNNGVDDDGSGQIDCLDPNCAFDPWCMAETDCDDGVDNDGDSATDCDDVGCNGLQGCVLPPEASCEDGIDNDADQTTDCDDQSCALWCAVPSCPAGTEKVYYRAGGAAVPIPDNGPTTPATKSILSAVDGLISMVAVRVDATHGNDIDLDMFLNTPVGDFELSTDNGSSGDNYVATVFIDSAAGRIGTTGFTTAPFTGTFRPEHPLASLAGTPTNGSWQLSVADDATNNTGTLDNFEMLFCQCDATSGDCEFGVFACRNGLDDDGDGLIDCAETSCATDLGCTAPPPIEEVCNDGVDDDSDGDMDCADSDCAWLCTALGSTCSGTRQLVRVGAVDLPQTISSTEMGLTYSPFWVSRTGTIYRAAVRFNATHLSDSDLQLHLTSPSGTTIELTSGNGSSGDNYVDTVFVDTAAGTIGTTGFNTAPFTGQYRPEQALSLLSFEGPVGMWTTQLRDTTTTNGGSWTEFSLGLCIIP